ncbi:hypothetical protein GTCCBUS3UF5_30430 [Geobacillus thermoleovorans CCB_US3_UF5]|uniref:Uncharacterized protein n=1 Tax=Geobacillus thermoleovorans CCB_US3_UF5 TaxID=1111068 RepID=A0ABM5ML62_GEOTH|nr:hypothetical protein GTCCBUS3UF5_30430 [Geobacillus thermoleovorans CCB_US3_UF5]EPR26993.1 hypothetical protein I656_03362 [Geobacillus sp. WSUCF1]
MANSIAYNVFLFVILPYVPFPCEGQQTGGILPKKKADCARLL